MAAVRKCLLKVRNFDFISRAYSRGQMCGGLCDVEDATRKIQAIVSKIKPDVEGKSGKSFEVFKAVNYACQVVSGLNYFVKVHVGGSDHLHLRIYGDIKGRFSLDGLQEGKGKADPIEIF